MKKLKEQVLEQAKRLQEGAEKNIKAGVGLYILHASCAAEFAKNVQKLLQGQSYEK